jgi:hypothetical protein
MERLAPLPPSQVQPGAETKQPAETQQKVPTGRGRAPELAYPLPASRSLEPRLESTFQSPKRRQESWPTPHSGQVEQPVVQQSYQPLMAREFQPYRPNGVGDMSQWNAKAASVGIPDRLRITQPEHQAEEIQIHIGRIEVTAVSPPLVRSPAPPVRRAIKLEEYLRRGRGNAS